MSDNAGDKTNGAAATDADAVDATDAKQQSAKTYTKSEVDAMVNKAKASARKDFADYNDLKVKAEQFDELDAKSKTDTERERMRADKAVRERDAALTRAQDSIVRSAIISAASKLGSVDPEAVAALLPRDELVIEGDEVIGVEEAVKALLAKKSYLRAGGSTRGGSELTGGGGNEPTVITRTQIKQWARTGQMTPERIKQVEEANKAGRVIDR